jgi:hypothetical protein
MTFSIASLLWVHDYIFVVVVETVILPTTKSYSMHGFRQEGKELVRVFALLRD